VPAEIIEEYLRVAAECLELARASKDERTRAGMVALAQMWAQLGGLSSRLVSRGGRSLQRLADEKTVGCSPRPKPRDALSGS
jgi:hypothetical protein